jgi:dolichol-phosphate mannosyltransferase
MEKNVKIVILIPAYEPDEVLIKYVEDLHKSGFDDVVVVNDGSGQGYQEIFDALEGSAHVIHHEVNKGKGAALKTGYMWIKENMPSVTGIITADSDGQHRPYDCRKLSRALLRRYGLLLGTRDFSQPQVPLRSKMGNRITSFMFQLLYRHKVKDTQTGLRAFPISLLDFMTDVWGERFEYEMNVLVECAKNNVPMVPVPIETVYSESPKSHFHTVKDAYKVYKVLFGNLFRSRRH